MKFTVPWIAVEADATGLTAELNREITPEHVLFGRNPKPVARRQDNDDVLFRLDDDTFAIAHLTWSGKPERHDGFPWTTVHNTIEDAIRSNAEDYSE